MFSKRDIILFLAGAEAFHTLSHLLISASGTLPLKIFFITLTQQLNLLGIVFNALITVGLLWWATKLK